MQDVIYLKNGSIIRGIIVEQIPNESIKIETRDGNLFVYKPEEVSKITKESAAKRTANKALKDNGYMGVVELGYGFDVGGVLSGTNRIQASMINGYKFSPHFYLGIGTGFIYYFDADTDVDEVSIPLYSHFKATFTNSDISPFASFNAGYNMSVQSGTFQGLLLEPALGVNYRTKKRNNLSFSIAYAMHRITYLYTGINYSIYEKEMAGALTFKFGFSF